MDFGNTVVFFKGDGAMSFYAGFFSKSSRCRGFRLCQVECFHLAAAFFLAALPWQIHAQAIGTSIRIDATQPWHEAGP